MALFEAHCRESLILLQNPYEEVHCGLDEYAGTPEYGIWHRKNRHHEEGITEIIRLFGDEAGRAAHRHIMTDIEEEGWVIGTHPFPRNEKHFVEMGLY